MEYLTGSGACISREPQERVGELSIYCMVESARCHHTLQVHRTTFVQRLFAPELQ